MVAAWEAEAALLVLTLVSATWEQVFHLEECSMKYKIYGLDGSKVDVVSILKPLNLNHLQLY